MVNIKDAWDRGTFPRRLGASTTSRCSTTCSARFGARPDIGRDRAAEPGDARYRGSVVVGSATCWKVRRFWNGNGGTAAPLASVQRFMSKQLAWGSSAHAPWP